MSGRQRPSDEVWEAEQRLIEEAIDRRDDVDGEAADEAADRYFGRSS